MCKAAVLLAASGVATAAVVPQPVVPYGNDSIRLPDGFQCSSSTSPGSYLDMGVYQTDSDYMYGNDKGVYFRVMVPIGHSVDRIDCSKLYEQALRERQRSKALENIKEKVFQ